MKTKSLLKLGVLCALAALGISVGCAAPPYVPAPVTNFSSVGWDVSTNATGYIVQAYPPSATNWANAFTTSGKNAPGVLTNYPSGTAFCVTATNASGESLPSNQITNIVNIAPAPPGVLTVK